MKKKAADWAVFSFLKAAQIWSTRPMRYSPVQADQKKPNWAATRPIWQHWGPSTNNIFCFFLLMFNSGWHPALLVHYRHPLIRSVDQTIG